MRIAIVGTGYVGLVVGTCLADSGNEVCCVDADARKVRVLDEGRLPIYEPGLEDLVRKNRAGRRLTFSTDLHEAVGRSEMVGGPPS